LKSSVAYADPGYDVFLNHGSEMEKNPDPGSGSGIGKNPDPESGYEMNTPDNFSESLETVFWAKKT
jgi:hypothetical protein